MGETLSYRTSAPEEDRDVEKLEHTDAFDALLNDALTEDAHTLIESLGYTLWQTTNLHYGAVDELARLIVRQYAPPTRPLETGTRLIKPALPTVDERIHFICDVTAYITTTDMSVLQPEEQLEYSLQAIDYCAWLLMYQDPALATDAATQQAFRLYKSAVTSYSRYFVERMAESTTAEELAALFAHSIAVDSLPWDVADLLMEQEDIEKGAEQPHDTV